MQMEELEQSIQQEKQLRIEFYSGFDVNDIHELENVINKLDSLETTCDIAFLEGNQNYIQIGLVFLVLSCISKTEIQLGSFIMYNKLNIDDQMVDNSIYIDIFQFLINQNVKDIQISGYFLNKIKESSLLQQYSQYMSLYDILSDTVMIQLNLKKLQIINGRQQKFNLEQITVNEELILNQCLFDISKLNLGQYMTELALNHCQLIDGDINMLCNYLTKQNILLTKIELIGNELTDLACLILSQCDGFKQLEKINLTDNKITIFGYKFIIGQYDLNDVEALKYLYNMVNEQLSKFNKYIETPQIYTLTQLKEINLSRNLIYSTESSDEIFDIKYININLGENLIQEPSSNQYKSLQSNIVQAAIIFVSKIYNTNKQEDLQQKIFTVIMQTIFQSNIYELRNALQECNIYTKDIIDQFYDLLNGGIDDIVLVPELIRIDQMIQQQCGQSLINNTYIIEANLIDQQWNVYTQNTVYNKILKASMHINFLQENMEHLPNIKYLTIYISNNDIELLNGLQLDKNEVKIIELITETVNEDELFHINLKKEKIFPKLYILQLNGTIIYNSIPQLKQYRSLNEIPDFIIWNYIFQEIDEINDLSDEKSQDIQQSNSEKSSQVVINASEPISEVQNLVQSNKDTQTSYKSYITTQELQFEPVQVQQESKYVAFTNQALLDDNKVKSMHFSLFNKQQRSLKVFKSQFQSEKSLENTPLPSRPVLFISEEYSDQIMLHRALQYRVNNFRQKRSVLPEKDNLKSGQLICLEKYV